MSGILQNVRGVGFAHQFTGIYYPTAERLQVVLSSLHPFALTVKKRLADCGKGLCFFHGFLALSNVSEETANTAAQHWSRSTLRLYSEIPASVFDS